MRIKKFLLRCNILTLFFSFLCNSFMPVFADKLRSGGALSLSVDNVPDSDIAHKVTHKDSQIKSVFAKASSDATPSIPASKMQDIQAKRSEKIDTQEKKALLLPSKLAANTNAAFPNKKPEANKNGENNTNLNNLNNLRTTVDVDAAKDSAKDTKNKNNEEKIVFNFEDVDLVNVAEYVEKLFGVKFITDEAIKPVVKGGKPLSGNKISFKTQKPLTKKQAWSLFVTFLNMAGLALVPQADPKFYRITAIGPQGKAIGKHPIPVYIGVDPNEIPDSDMIIRYGYFVRDCPLDTIKNVLESLRSSASGLLILHDHNAFIITDNAYNIKVLMKIVKELDRVTMPQSMSVLRLYKVDADHVAKVYKALTQDEKEGTVAARLFGPKKPSKALYFPKKAKIIVEPRTNSLVLLGTAEDIKKIEDFIRNRIDVDVRAPYSPLHIYELKYANCVDIANIMNNLVKFGTEKTRGGLRGGDKYFKNMSFTAEKEGNRLIIRGDYDDYLKVKEIIDKIDEPPVQVAIEILILGVEVQDQRELGAQIRNKFRSPDGTQINFQTSGITLGAGRKSIVPNTADGIKGNLRLLGDLISLVSGSAPATTAISLGSDRLGVWGIFGILNEISNTQIVSNPFLTATNNTKAKVKLGETRRIVTAEVVGDTTTESRGDYEANIEVEVTPKINSDGMIVMDLKIIFDSFLAGSSEAKTTRTIETSIVAANKEVLALGGLLKNKDEDSLSRVPVLGRIPILGWLFKNKKKVKNKEDLLVLITANIIDPTQDIKEFTKRHVKDYKDTIKEFNTVKSDRDPIDRSFFKDEKAEFGLEDFIFKRGRESNKYLNKNKTKKAQTKKPKKAKKPKKKINARKIRSRVKTEAKALRPFDPSPGSGLRVGQAPAVARDELWRARQDDRAEVKAKVKKETNKRKTRKERREARRARRREKCQRSLPGVVEEKMNERFGLVGA